MRINTLMVLLYKILWIFTLVLYIVIPFGNESLMRMCYYGFYVLNFLLFFIAVITTLKSKDDEFNIQNLIIICGILVGIIMSVMMSSKSITFEVHGAAIMGYLCSIISIYYLRQLSFDRKLLNFIFGINVCISIVFAILSRTSYAYSSILEDSLNLGYSNPNATAIYLFLNIIYLLLFLNYLEKKKYIFAVLCLIAYQAYLIYCTDSRTCMFVAIVILLYGLNIINFKVKKWWIFAALAFPIVFLFVYTILYENRLFMDLEIMGKEFYSGREGYFAEQLNLVKDYWLFGDIGKHRLTNMHNGFLSLFASLGLVGTVLYYIFIIRNLLNGVEWGCKNKTAMMAMVAILAVYIQTSSEAALMTGGSNYTIPIAALYMLLYTEFDRKKKYCRRHINGFAD